MRDRTDSNLTVDQFIERLPQLRDTLEMFPDLLAWWVTRREVPGPQPLAAWIAFALELIEGDPS